MSRSPLWREFESGEGILPRTLRFLVLTGGALFLGFSGVLALGWQHQLLLGGLTLAIALWMNRGSKSQLVTLTLVILSVYSSFRYGFWRVSTTIAYLRDPGTQWTPLDAFFIGLLLVAEGYAFLVLVLGYFQVLWPLRRMPAPLPDDPNDWPAVDLLIPTYDEPLRVVRFTALAAMNIDWPGDKLHVYLLDDGRREEFRAFAEEAGIGYLARSDNRHAKAGNLNHALMQLNSPFVAVFDCDHVPTRSFLQLTMGWMLRDAKLGMLQTPHHSYSPDPFERNLDQFRAVPTEDELYYGVVQDGNDFWNAACFCGSCAVLRRSALDQVGGVAVETVTEDAHTSLRMQRSGWNTAYINIPQAAGLATERLSEHIRQRIRWARGMVQILHLENPLFASGLRPAQRLCYFNSMVHFLFALPRMIFLTAPLMYLVFGRTSIAGFWAAIVAYGLPHLALAGLAHSRIQGEHRHTFWNEIYETVLAPYILLPTFGALIHPSQGEFRVTPKGGLVEREYFDARIARPFVALLTLNVLGMLCAIARCMQLPSLDVPPWLWWVNWPAHLYQGGHHLGIIAVNAVWTLFNIAILGVATGVARESRQRRESVRVAMAVPSDVILPDGDMVQGVTADLSGGGVRTRVGSAVKAKVGDAIQFVFPVLDGTATLPATIVAIEGRELRARFTQLTLQQDEALTMLLYSRADSWLDWGSMREPDNALRSLGRILRLSLRGVGISVGRSRGQQAKERVATSVVPLVLLAVLACASALAQSAGPRPAATTAAGTFDHGFTLADAGAGRMIALHGAHAQESVAFSVPASELVKTATLRLRYRFSPGLLPGVSQLRVALNGTPVATLAAGTGTNSSGGDLEAIVALPAELLVADNRINFEFIGRYAAQCEDPANSAIWSEIDPRSTVDLSGVRVPLAGDLGVLPAPFYDSGVNARPTVPIVFLSQPSAKAMQAAGVVASWLGILYEERPVRFTVSIGAIPAGNAIVLAEDPAEIPLSLAAGGLTGASVAMRANPSDPYSSLLLVSGDNADQLLTAASALALHADAWQGAQVEIDQLTLPAPRAADDAPRWLSTGKPVEVGQLAAPGGLESDGTRPVELTLRLPPDLDYGDRRNLAFHLGYRYNSAALAAGSTLRVEVNGAYVSSTPMPHTDKASAALDTVVPVPVSDLRPYSNTMRLSFLFHAASAGQCGGAPPNLEGAVLKDSYLDISGIRHSAALPDLALFAGAGFPFTRRADLGGTAVVLPDRPSAGELELFLAVMGHFGAQVGYPALRVTVTNAAGMSRDGGKDYLVMGAAADMPALRVLDSSLPVGVDAGGLHLRDTGGFFDRAVWWQAGQAQAGQMRVVGSLPEALIEGVQWPAGTRRSVVLIVLRDEAEAPNFVNALLSGSQSEEIAQSVSVLHGGQFTSYRMGGGAYRVGEVSPVAPVARTLESFPWLIALTTVLLCFLMAVLAQARLRRHARVRLQAAEVSS